MRGFSSGLRGLALMLLMAAFVCGPLAWEALARSASGPRHTGLEPPGGPRRLEMMPGNSPSRTAEGGMGYTDAYGNTIEDRQPEEKRPRHRPRPGAYGGYGKKQRGRSLPEPLKPETPLWSF